MCKTNLFLGHSFGFVIHPARLLQNLVECCSDVVYHFQCLENQTVLFGGFYELKYMN